MRRIAALLAAATLTLAAPVRAHETDNFCLPLDRTFADIGDFFDAAHCRAIEKSVESLNREITAALRIKDPRQREQRLAYLHQPERLVSRVYARFNDPFFEIQDIEHAIRGEWRKKTHPGEITAHRTMDWIYTYSHFWLDPRRLILVWQSSTVKAYGVYFGTDKLSHFHHMGKFYYDAYRARIRDGASEEDAMAAVARKYADKSVIGEDSLLGYIATGVFSNGDLAANYMGFKFFRNLTEPVMLKGEIHEPLVVRRGDYYRVAKHVRPESGWFGAFVSDHWNEAFNPSVFDPTIRDGVRSVLRRRGDKVLEFYTTRDGRPADADYYNSLADELSTYYGEPYGRRGDSTTLMTIGNTCMTPDTRLARP